MTSFFTGEIPMESVFDADNMLLPVGYIASSMAWSGCLDAPSYMPAGSSFYSKSASMAAGTICIRPA